MTNNIQQTAGHADEPRADRRTLTGWSRLGALGMMAACTLFGQPEKFSGDLKEWRADGEMDVIVQFASDPDEDDLQELSLRGAKLRGRLQGTPEALFRVSAGTLKRLANNPKVRYITPDREVTAAMDYEAATVGAVQAFSSGFDGRGIGVAVIDSGVDGVTDLKDPVTGKSRVVHHETFLGDFLTLDLFGHGTHVAGIVAGSGADSTGEDYTRTFRGIAPGAHIVSLRALDAKGRGTDSTVIAAINRAIALRARFNIRVLNLSLGRPVRESYTRDPLCQAVERAWKAGIVVVAAAGNQGRDDSHGTDGYATITSPGNSPYVITVGAMRANRTPSRGDDAIASYSSKGPTLLDQIVKPDLVAPGNRVISLRTGLSNLLSRFPGNTVSLRTYLRGGFLDLASPSYFTFSGTSMATPMVSGAAALLLQQQPSLTPDQVKARLMRTATKDFPASSVGYDVKTGQAYTSRHDLFTVGAGYLDVWAALNNSDVLPAGTTALSPRAVRDPKTGAVSLVMDQSVVWGTNIVWGTNVLWGTNIVWGTNVLWGTNIVWGTGGNPQGTSIVWGTNVVWGSSNEYSESVLGGGDQ